MKKAVFIVFLGIVGLSAISAQTMPNPWIECGNDISCGAQKAGFNFPLNVENYTVRAMEGMFEFRFPLDEKRKVIVRKSVTAEGEADENGIIDISGDYNDYSQTESAEMSGMNVTLRGNDNKIFNVTWNSDGYSYAIVSDKGLERDDVEAIVGAVK